MFLNRFDIILQIYHSWIGSVHSETIFQNLLNLSLQNLISQLSNSQSLCGMSCKIEFQMNDIFRRILILDFFL